MNPRWVWILLGLLLGCWLSTLAYAGTPLSCPPSDDPLQGIFCQSLSAHLNTLECLNYNPDGLVFGTHGELKCAVFDGVHHLCMNTSTGPAKGLSWFCAGESSAGPRTAGVFCGSTLSTVMDCEEWRGRIPFDCVVNRVDAFVTTAPVGSAIVIDINQCDVLNNCLSIWDTTPANRLQVLGSELTGTQSTFDTTTLTAGNFLGFDLDQVGSSTTGGNLTVTLTCS